MKLKQNRLAHEWFDRGQSDFQYAQAGQRETRRHHITCFLCHQAVEKILKGLIAGAGETPEKTHSLRGLLTQVQKLHPDLKWNEKGIRRLDAFYIPSRYPGPIQQDFIEKDALEALEIAAQILEMLSLSP